MKSMRAFGLRAWMVVCGVSLCGGAADALHAGTIRHDRTQQQHLDLGAQSIYDAVGRMDHTGASGGTIGSGTLIASQWVLTAAHVVQGAETLRFTVGGATYTADAWVTNPGWDGNLSAGYDLALVHLGAAVSNVAAAKRYTGSAELNAQATIVGYGMTGTGNTGAVSFDGKRRAGMNTIDTVQNGRVLRFDFDSPTNPTESSMGSNIPLDLEYLLAGGDSGGAVFMTYLGQTVLIGVNSFGASTDGSTNSDYGDSGGAVRVSAFNSWINSVLASSLDTLATGVFGAYGGTVFDLAAPEQSEPTHAPEPSSLAVMGVAAIMLARVRRRG